MHVCYIFYRTDIETCIIIIIVVAKRHYYCRWYCCYFLRSWNYY